MSHQPSGYPSESIFGCQYMHMLTLVIRSGLLCSEVVFTSDGIFRWSVIGNKQLSEDISGYNFIFQQWLNNPSWPVLFQCMCTFRLMLHSCCNTWMLIYHSPNLHTQIDIYIGHIFIYLIRVFCLFFFLNAAQLFYSGHRGDEIQK